MELIRLQKIVVVREVGSMSNLGGHTILRALFLNKEGHFLNIKKSFLSLLPNPAVKPLVSPLSPVPTSLVVVEHSCSKPSVWPSALQLCESLATKPISGLENIISSLHLALTENKPICSKKNII